MAQDQAGGGGDLMPGEPPALKEAQHIRRATPVQSAEHDMATGMLLVCHKPPSQILQDGFANLQQLSSYMVHLEA